MGINTASAFVGFAKQTAKASGATTATFAHGIASGKPFDRQPELTEDNISTGNVMIGGANLSANNPGSEYETRMFAMSIGAYLYAILGGKAVSGSSTYTHVLSVAAAQPWFTTWGKLGSQWYKTIDSKLVGLNIEITGAGVVKVSPKWLGCTPSKVTAPTITNDETAATPFAGAGGTFQWDQDGSTLATAKIVSANVSIERAGDYEQIAASITPDNISDGGLKITGALTLRPDDDTDLWDSTNISAAEYGSFSLGLASGANTVTLASTRATLMGGWPDYDANGASALVPFAFQSYGDSNFTATVVNTLASY